MTLYNNGDFSTAARNMEQAITQFFEVYEDCLAGCEGSYEIVEFKDFYPTLAGSGGGRRRRAPEDISTMLFSPSSRPLQRCVKVQDKV